MLKSFANGTVFGEEHGEGLPRILALHGWGRDRSDFRAVLNGLNSLALDLPGFGTSPEPAEALGAGGYADMIAPVLDEIAESVVVLGHSFGGRVAVHLAVARPAQVSGLVLAGVPLMRRGDAQARRPKISYRLVRALHRAGLLGESRLEQVRRRHGSADYRNATGIMRNVLVRVVNETYEPELKRIQCPVHLVWGANDREVPVDVAERSAQLLARSELSVVEGVGHHVCRDAPEAVRAIVVGALS